MFIQILLFSFLLCFGMTAEKRDPTIVDPDLLVDMLKKLESNWQVNEGNGGKVKDTEVSVKASPSIVDLSPLSSLLTSTSSTHSNPTSYKQNQIVGKTNTISGTNNSVYGHSNNIYGFYNSLQGSENLLTGQANNIWGGKNKVIGYSNIIAGEKNKGVGQGNKMVGDGNYLKGEGNWMLGEENGLVGKGNYVIGKGNRVNGGIGIEVKSQMMTRARLKSNTKAAEQPTAFSVSNLTLTLPSINSLQTNNYKYIKLPNDRTVIINQPIQSFKIPQHLLPDLLNQYKNKQIENKSTKDLTSEGRIWGSYGRKVVEEMNKKMEIARSKGVRK